MVMPVAPARRPADVIGREGIRFRQLVTFRIVEGMRGRAEGDDGFARVEILSEVFQLVRRQSSPAEKEDYYVSVIESFESGKVLFRVLVRERFQHRRTEAVAGFSSFAI